MVCSALITLTRYLHGPLLLLLLLLRLMLLLGCGCGDSGGRDRPSTVAPRRRFRAPDAHHVRDTASDGQRALISSLLQTPRRPFITTGSKF